MKKNYFLNISTLIFILLLTTCTNSENEHLTNSANDEIIISPYASTKNEILGDAKKFYEDIASSELRSLSRQIDYEKTEISSYYEKIPVTSDMQVKKSVKYQQIPVYMINYKTENNEPAGFVIKAGDSRTGNLTLAFSDEGHFDGFDKLEESDGGYFKERIGAYIFSTIEQIPISEEMEKRANAVYTRAYKPPLLKVTWNQHPSPYYDYAPICSGKTPTPAGCVTIALAQIMTFHKWPEKGYYIRKTTGQSTPVVYNYWNEITKTPKAINLTNSNHKEHVANLCAEIGYRTFTNYNCSGSTASNYNIIGALKKMGYKNMILRSERDQNYDFVYVWDDIMMERPVYMATENRELWEAHAYVVDGIQTVQANNGYGRNFYIHVNFGWGGQSNGFYLVYPGIKANEPIFIDEEFEFRTTPTIITNIQKDSQNSGATNANLF